MKKIPVILIKGTKENRDWVKGNREYDRNKSSEKGDQKNE